MSNHFEWFEDEFEDGESYTDIITGTCGIKDTKTGIKYGFDCLLAIDEFLGLLNELSSNSKLKDKTIKHHNNKIKQLKRDKQVIISHIKEYVHKYEAESEKLRFTKPNTPKDYIVQGRLRMLGDLLNVLESYEVQEE